MSEKFRCPDCGDQAYIDILTSNPPQYSVHCSDSECGYERVFAEFPTHLLAKSPITAEQVAAYMAQQSAAAQAEDEALFHELQAWLAERNAEIVAVLRLINVGDRQAAVPVWGVGKRRAP